MSDAARLKILTPSFHQCAKCLKTIDRGVIGAREATGTKVTVRCHGYWTSAIVDDTFAEDHRRYFWFADDEGKPFETRAMKHKRELREDLEKQRAELRKP